MQKEGSENNFRLTWHFGTTCMIHAKPGKEVGYLRRRQEEEEKERGMDGGRVASSALFESKNVNLN